MRDIKDAVVRLHGSVHAPGADVFSRVGNRVTLFEVKTTAEPVRRSSYQFCLAASQADFVLNLPDTHSPAVEYWVCRVIDAFSCPPSAAAAAQQGFDLA